MLDQLKTLFGDKVTDAEEVVEKTKSFLTDYLFLFIIIVVIAVAIAIAIYAIKHMPHKGRITDVFDKNGNIKKHHHEDDDDDNIDIPNFKY